MDLGVQIIADPDPTWTFLWPWKKICRQKGTGSTSLKFINELFFLRFLRIFDYLKVIVQIFDTAPDPQIRFPAEH